MTGPSFNREEAISFGQLIAIADVMYAPGLANPPVPPDLTNDWEVLKNMTVEATLDFIKEKEFIGFVARSLADPTHLVTVLHGSRSILDFFDDFEFQRTPFPYFCNGGETELGFTRLYESLTFIDPPSTDAPTPPSSGAEDPGVQDPHPVDLKTFLADPAMTSAAHITVAGHSLGGALGILHGAVLGGAGIPVDVYTFGAPMVGDEVFVQAYGGVVRDSYAIVNKPDIVPHLPGILLGYASNGEQVEVNSLEFPELRHTISCFHDLSTYLHVLGDVTVDISKCRA